MMATEAQDPQKTEASVACAFCASSGHLFGLTVPNRELRGRRVLSLALSLTEARRHGATAPPIFHHEGQEGHEENALSQMAAIFMGFMFFMVRQKTYVRLRVT